MKHFYGLLLTSLFLGLAVSCTQEQPAPEQEDYGILIPAGIEREDTKVGFDNNGKFSWTEGDHIAVWDHGAYVSARLAKIGDDGTGYFALPQTSTDRSQYALYPFDILDEGRNGSPGKDLCVNYPVNYYVENSESGWQERLANFFPTPMIAKNEEGEKLHFRHLGAVISLTIKNIPANTKMIFISTNERITGKFKVHDPASAAPYISMSDPEASGHENFVRVFYRERKSEKTNITVNIPFPPGRHEKIYVTTYYHVDANNYPATSWGSAYNHRELTRGEGRKVTIDLAGSHLFSLKFATEDVTTVAGYTAELPYSALKNVTDEFTAGEGLTLTCTSSNPAVAEAVITPDSASDRPIFKVKGISAGTTEFFITATTTGGDVIYHRINVNVVNKTGMRVDLDGLPNMVEGNKQTITPSLWIDPPVSKELVYDWSCAWESNNTSTATVDTEGLVTALNTPGPANIKCTATLVATDASSTSAQSIIPIRVLDPPAGTIKGAFTYDQFGTPLYWSRANLLYYKASNPSTGYYMAYDRLDPVASTSDGIWTMLENQYDFYNGRINPFRIDATRTDEAACPAFDHFNYLISREHFADKASTKVLYDEVEQYVPDPVNYPERKVWRGKDGTSLGTGWRAPTHEEWSYLLFARKATTLNGVKDARFMKMKISGLPKLNTNNDYVTGLIIFPDVYNHPEGVSLPKAESINNRNAGWADVTYSLANFEKLEAAGCVFLPASGYYPGLNEKNSLPDLSTNTKISVGNVNSRGYYYDNNLYNQNPARKTAVRMTNGDGDGGLILVTYTVKTPETDDEWDSRMALRLVHD